VFHERPPSQEAVAAWLKQPKKRAANVGTITGPASNLTVVDVDEPSLVGLALKSFGDTPLIQRTPRGGYHLLYRYSGEGSPTRLDGKPIDVRGRGGYVVLSPSQIGGKSYLLQRGSLLTDLRQLPAAKGLPKAEAATGARISRLVGGDGRNNSVFMALKNWAAENGLQSEEHAYVVAQSFDAQLNEEPLSERELRATARQIFGYQEHGTLFTTGARFARIAESDYRKLGESVAAQRVKGMVRSIAVDLYQRASLTFGNSPPRFPSRRRRWPVTWGSTIA
jgi:hypothetical protein